MSSESTLVFSEGHHGKDMSLLCLYPRVEFKEVELTKDTCLFPSYIVQAFGLETRVVYGNTAANRAANVKPGRHRGVDFEEIMLPSTYGRFTFGPGLAAHPFMFLRFLLTFASHLRKAKGIYTHLMLFHVTRYSYLLAWLAKTANSRLRIYLKADMRLSFAKRLAAEWGTVDHFFFSHIDLVSVETTEVREVLSGIRDLKGKLALIPNGLDEPYGNTVFSLPQKENLIFSVARFGSHPKNSELLLSVISRVDLTGWKVVLAGPIEKEERDFQEYIERFYAEHPHLRQSVSFIGNVADRERLNELYSAAKVFLFTSRYESFGFSLLEAACFGDYILSTDVGAARDVVGCCGYGHVVARPADCPTEEQAILEELTAGLSSIIKGDVLDEVQALRAACKAREAFSMGEIVKKPELKAFFGGQE